MNVQNAGMPIKLILVSTFLIVGILFINLFYYIFITKKQVRGINSIVFLSVIGILYLINLLIFKKKYGD